MKAYKIELLVLDFEEMGEAEIRHVLENARYPNHCIAPSVKAIAVADIGAWDDSHPLNQNAACDVEYKRLFGGENA